MKQFFFFSQCATCPAHYKTLGFCYGSVKGAYKSVVRSPLGLSEGKLEKSLLYTGSYSYFNRQKFQQSHIMSTDEY